MTRFAYLLPLALLACSSSTGESSGTTPDVGAQAGAGGASAGAGGASAGKGGTSSAGAGGAAVCVAGKQEACVCPGGATGAQACFQDGSGYGQCMCGTAGAGGAAGGSAGAAGSSGSGAGAGASGGPAGGAGGSTAGAAGAGGAGAAGKGGTAGAAGSGSPTCHDGLSCQAGDMCGVAQTPPCAFKCFCTVGSLACDSYCGAGGAPSNAMKDATAKGCSSKGKLNHCAEAAASSDDPYLWVCPSGTAKPSWCVPSGYADEWCCPWGW